MKNGTKRLLLTGPTHWHPVKAAGALLSDGGQGRAPFKDHWIIFIFLHVRWLEEGPPKRL